MRSEEIFPLVDPTGHIIGQAPRSLCHNGSKLLHPVVHLHLLNSEGELYLQQRAFHKDIQPGKWDTAVGGHIDLNESPEEALKRESFEELGIVDFSSQFITRYIFESEIEQELVYVYRAVSDQTVRPNPGELEGGKFWTIEDIRTVLGKGILTPNFEQEFIRLQLLLFNE